MKRAESAEDTRELRVAERIVLMSAYKYKIGDNEVAEICDRIVIAADTQQTRDPGHHPSVLLVPGLPKHPWKQGKGDLLAD